MGSESAATSEFAALLRDPAFCGAAFSASEMGATSPRADPAAGLLARLLAKRVVLALLSEQERPELSAERPEELARVEVLTTDTGAPTVRLSRQLSRRYDPFAIHLSLSHEGGLCVAFAVIDAAPPQMSAPG